MVEEFEIDELEVSGYQPDFNVAPTKQAPVVVERRPKRVAETLLPSPTSITGAEPRRQLRLLTWGLVPSWAKDRSGGSRLINARAESLLDKPAFRRAALTRRCLVPADGWFEWQIGRGAPDAKQKPRKQPFFIHPVPGAESLAFAGVYEFWRDPQAPPDDDGAWLTTYAIITTAAEPGLAAIHDRMPLALPADRWSDWLDPDQSDPLAVRALMATPPPGRFAAVPVSTRVNAVANNGPALLEPAAPESLF